MSSSSLFSHEVISAFIAVKDVNDANVNDATKEVMAANVDSLLDAGSQNSRKVSSKEDVLQFLQETWCEGGCRQHPDIR
jgi:hypothetical protein